MIAQRLFSIKNGFISGSMSSAASLFVVPVQLTAANSNGSEEKEEKAS